MDVKRNALIAARLSGIILLTRCALFYTLNRLLVQNRSECENHQSDTERGGRSIKPTIDPKEFRDINSGDRGQSRERLQTEGGGRGARRDIHRRLHAAGGYFQKGSTSL
jgi:hypothetical protein